MAKIELERGERNSATHDFLLAFEKWQRANPMSAAHNNRLYADRGRVLMTCCRPHWCGMSNPAKHQRP